MGDRVIALNMKKGHWIPRGRMVLVAGMTALLAFGAFAADSPFGKKRPEFLPVDEAFELQPLVRTADGALEVSWRIAKDYYLYRDRLKFTPGAALELGKPALPASLPYQDEHFGTVQVYRDRLAVQLPAARAAKGARLTVTYQGCADAGLCYPPQTRTLELEN
jgi:thiol:disulfide interchange protein DsbD